MHAVERAAVPDAGTALVLGCGTIGALTIAALRAGGRARASSSVAKYRHQQETARRLGADDVLGTGEIDARRSRPRAGTDLHPTELGPPTSLGGADVTFDCISTSRTLDDAMRFTRARGAVIVVGMPGVPDGVDWTAMWHKELDVRGSYTSDEETFGRAVATAARLDALLAPLVGARFALEEWTGPFAPRSTPARPASSRPCSRRDREVPDLQRQRARSPRSSPTPATVYYPPPIIRGLSREEIPRRLTEALENPLGMEPLSQLVRAGLEGHDRVRRQLPAVPAHAPAGHSPAMIERLLELLYDYGVRKRDITLRCAIALHRKMQVPELEHMLGPRIMAEFHPPQLANFDAEDKDDIVDLGSTPHGEPVQTSRAVVDGDLVIYVDTIQIPLNGGHKSVAVGFGTYDSIAPHHNPAMTEDTPHVMQPDGSCMHDSITRISRQLQKHCRIMVIEAAMNGATYPPHLRHLAKPPERLSAIERSCARPLPRR